jgi:hypothetical protein
MARGRPSRATVYARLDAAVIELRTRLGGLPTPKESETIWADIWHREAHHSTALEGNTLVLREVEALLEKGRAVGAKPLSEYMEVRGYGDAARWVYGQPLEPDVWSDGELITLNELRRIHYLAMSPAWSIAPQPTGSTRYASSANAFTRAPNSTTLCQKPSRSYTMRSSASAPSSTETGALGDSHSTSSSFAWATRRSSSSSSSGLPTSRRWPRPTPVTTAHSAS